MKIPSIAIITKTIRRLKETPLLISLLDLKELACVQLECFRYASHTDLLLIDNVVGTLLFL